MTVMDEDTQMNVPPQEPMEEEEEDTLGYVPMKEGEEKDITKDGGVKKKLIKAGEGWEKPETGDEVSVHYTGTLLDGTKFDSSLDRGDPFQFKLGQGQVIKGWDKGIATMKKGEKAVFTIASDYAYGKAGSPPKIPADATLQFEVELLSWISVKDICGDGGIFKKIVVEGKKWETPKEQDQATVKFEAKLEDGTILAKSDSEEGTEFYINQGLLCPAIPRALKTMHKGEKAILTVKPSYGFGEAGREAHDGMPAVAPNATITIDLELVGWKKVENVTEDGKVVKKILVDGEGYERPNDGATVHVRYTMKVKDGAVVEKKGLEGDGFTFVTDEEQVIQALDKAVMKMKKGEKALITIAAEYAYGSKGATLEDGQVPADATVEVEMELISFEKDKESWELNDDEKVENAAKKKEEGNALYKAGKYERASKKYEKAVKLIEYDTSLRDDLKKQSKALKVSCNLNDAACKLKLKDYISAVKLTTKVLDLESTNVKALYRRAQGYVGTQDYDMAEWDVKKALDLDPDNKELKAELRFVKQKMAQLNKREQKLYGNMFARLKKLEEKETKVEAVPMETEVAPENGQANVEADAEKPQSEAAAA